MRCDVTGFAAIVVHAAPADRSSATWGKSHTGIVPKGPSQSSLLFELTKRTQLHGYANKVFGINMGIRSNRAAMRGSSREGTDDLQVHSCEWVRGYLLV